MPKPFAAKARSIASRGGPLRGVRGAAREATSRSASRSSSSPAPVCAETGTIGAPASGPAASKDRTSSAASAASSGAATSVFVSATTPCARPSSSQIARCSRVCGITPSSAATTSSTRSMPGGAGHHRAHEPFVPGHVDDREAQAAVEIERREAQLDGDAARLLLGQAIGIDAGQRAHEPGLAVVDVAGGAEHESGDFARLRLTARTASRRLRRI